MFLGYLLLVLIDSIRQDVVLFIWGVKNAPFFVERTRFQFYEGDRGSDSPTLTEMIKLLKHPLNHDLNRHTES